MSSIEIHILLVGDKPNWLIRKVQLAMLAAFVSSIDSAERLRAQLSHTTMIT